MTKLTAFSKFVITLLLVGLGYFIFWLCTHSGPNPTVAVPQDNHTSTWENITVLVVFFAIFGGFDFILDLAAILRGGGKKDSGADDAIVIFTHKLDNKRQIRLMNQTILEVGYFVENQDGLIGYRINKNSRIYLLHEFYPV